MHFTVSAADIGCFSWVKGFLWKASELAPFFQYLPKKAASCAGRTQQKKTKQEMMESFRTNYPRILLPNLVSVQRHSFRGSLPTHSQTP